ncbi:hypothetical protein [Sphingomonas sp. IW22]|uniref:hypothetical protein n=1 Tax=Sphingomonas sp. IW22 TaxID=3242489 RepID=UPI0035209539
MRWKRWISLIALPLAACGGGDVVKRVVGGDGDAGLERAAMDRGLVRAPGDAPMTGLYASGGDRLCIVEQGRGARIGVVRDHGPGQSCAAAGVAERDDDIITVTLGAAGDCEFDAVFDGESLAFPPQVPAGCRRFCGVRGTLTDMSVERLSESVAEATALRDGRRRMLCDS